MWMRRSAAWTACLLLLIGAWDCVKVAGLSSSRCGSRPTASQGTALLVATTSSRLKRSSLQRASRLQSDWSTHSESEPSALHHDVSPTLISKFPAKLAQFAAGVLLASSCLALGVLTPASADEYGIEVEAPTLFTGESVMICKKRGPLGACLETAERTQDNDNDKAQKYFQEPKSTTSSIKLQKQQQSEQDAGNALITKLRQQTLDNKEQNDLVVRQKTLLNDQSASFGPFDKQVVILNTDGKTFTLLQSPQAMRLKKAGFIEDRKFVQQPTSEQLEEAMTGNGNEEGGGIGGAIQGFLGGVGS